MSLSCFSKSDFVNTRKITLSNIAKIKKLLHKITYYELSVEVIN